MSDKSYNQDRVLTLREEIGKLIFVKSVRNSSLSAAEYALNCFQ